MELVTLQLQRTALLKVGDLQTFKWRVKSTCFTILNNILTTHQNIHVRNSWRGKNGLHHEFVFTFLIRVVIKGLQHDWRWKRNNVKTFEQRHLDNYRNNQHNKSQIHIFSDNVDIPERGTVGRFSGHLLNVTNLLWPRQTRKENGRHVIWGALRCSFPLLSLHLHLPTASEQSFVLDLLCLRLLFPLLCVERWPPLLGVWIWKAEAISSELLYWRRWSYHKQSATQRWDLWWSKGVLFVCFIRTKTIGPVDIIHELL